jgi:hypothetical protein
MEPTMEGHEIQDLKKIGDKIVYAAAFSDQLVNLGSNVKNRVIL